jgi:hypothetical protein
MGWVAAVALVWGGVGWLFRQGVGVGVGGVRSLGDLANEW